MNSENITVDTTLVYEGEEERAAPRLAELLSQAVYAALLTLIFIAAVAYGGSDPWWKAFFASAMFAVGIVATVEVLFTPRPRFPWFSILLPLLSLVVFSLCQTIPLSKSLAPSLGISQPVWNSISADPYETRIFALQLLALTLFAAMLFRYATTERRISFLIHFIIAIAVLSAIFGLIRQTAQHEAGFGLPLLLPDQGYGQFINKNHFAFLMEAGFGLSLGMLLARGEWRDRGLIYVGASLPIWTALVLSLSRGGILAMMVQAVVALLLSRAVLPERDFQSRFWRFVQAPVVRLILIVGLITISLFGVLWVGGDRLADSIEGARTEFEKDDLRVGATRTQIWQATLRMIADHPFAGVGLGGYWTAIPAYHDASGSSTPQQAHNDYLELVASGGVVALALFIWFVVIVLRRARRNLRSQHRFRRATCFAGLIALTGIAVHSLVEFGLHRMLNAMIFMALLVCVTSALQMDSDSPDLEDE